MPVKFHALRGLVKRFKKLDADKLVSNALKSSTSLQQDILDLNRLDQLYDKGITADGKYLGAYSPATIEGTGQYAGKKAKGERYDHITLHDMGDFYASFKIAIEPQKFIISGDTQKPDVDLMTYGEILGLTEQNKKVVAGWLRIPFISEFRKAVLTR